MSVMQTESAARFALWPLPDFTDGAPDRGADGEVVGTNQYEEGFAAGYERARKESGTDAASLVDVLRGATQRYDEMREGLHAEIHEYAVGLALAVAKQVIHREVSVDERLVVDAVKRILDSVGEKGPVRIHLHPEDLACSQSYRILDEWPSAHEWIADPSVERGGCVIESAGRSIDGTIGTILDDLARRLADV